MDLKERVIHAVYNEPALWDKDHKNHRNRYALERKWKQVAMNVGESDKIVKSTWKNLRQEFKKQLRKADRSPESDLPESHWPYFNSLLFLHDQFLGSSADHRSDHGSDDSADDVDLNALLSVEMSSSDNFEYSPPPPPPNNSNNNTASNGHGDRKRHRQMMLDYGMNLNAAMPQVEADPPHQHKRRKSKVDSSDEDVGFFNSLLPHVRHLSPRDKMMFRLKTQQALFDLSFPPSADSNGSSEAAACDGDSK